MSLEKELHVVIKLPFRRPSDFVEPPQIAWTEDMEHQLWKHISQNHTDWEYIAEQFGLPASYLVRHAAFMYETQLRGIQQQLRLSVSTSTSTITTHRSNTASSHRQAPPVSASSTSSQQQQQRQQISAQDHQVRHALPVTTTSISTRSTIISSNDTTKASTLPTSAHPSPISRQGDNRHLIATHNPIVSSVSNMDVEVAAMATAPMGQYLHLTHDDGMLLSAISDVTPRDKSSCNNDSNSGTDITALASQNDNPRTVNRLRSQQNRSIDITNTSISSHPKNRDNMDLQEYEMKISNDYNTCVGKNEDYDDHADTIDDDEITRKIGDSKANDNSNDDGDDEDDARGGFSYHFDNMKREIGEPAFLPSRKIEGSQLLGSLCASLRRSRPTLPRKTLATSTRLPAHHLDSPRNASQQGFDANTFLDQAQTTHYSHRPSSLISPMTDNHRSIETTSINADTKDNTHAISNDKRKMVFGPNLSRATLTQPFGDANKGTNSAFSSAGSSFSDFSDNSVTRSAMEDAMLSKLNDGSKMSSLTFSKKLT